MLVAAALKPDALLPFVGVLLPPPLPLLHAEVTDMSPATPTARTAMVRLFIWCQPPDVTRTGIPGRGVKMPCEMPCPGRRRQVRTS